MPYRKDQKITKAIPGYRRILSHLSPSRNSALINFTQTLDVTKTLKWIKDYEQEHGQKVSLVYVFILAIGRVLYRYPHLNRYVSGNQFYQRSDVTVSVSVKKQLTDGAKVVVLKVPVQKDDTLEDIIQRFSKLLGEGRGGDIHQEKEVGLFLKFPAFVLNLLLKLVNWLDRRHWLPGFFVDPDPLFTSIVVANLGSVGIDAAYHHLYEYGNCPFFAVMGKIHKKAVVQDDAVVIREVMDIKYSFDERVEDGLACALGLASFQEMVEDPEKFKTGIKDWQGRPPK